MPSGPLVDTSVLIDYFGGVTNVETDALDGCLAAGPPPATAPIIVQEFLQGFRLARDFDAAAEALAWFDRLDPPDYPAHEAAARLHVETRRRGHTASTVDTLIVAMALAAGRPLLTRDAAQRAFAGAVGVTIFQPA